MKKRLILLKLGGSSITDKNVPYKVNEKAIRRYAKEIKKAVSKNQFIIAHGAGSFAHTSASKYGGMKGYKNKLGIAKVSRDVTSLNQIVTDIFVEEGLPVVSIRPMGMILSKEGKLSDHLFEVLEQVLNQGLIPIVFGDIIWDKRWKSTIYSGERTLSEICFYILNKGYKIEKVIQVGDTNGLYNLNGKTIKLVNLKNANKINKFFQENVKIDVTGGMKHKIENALVMARSGIQTILINGNVPDDLIKAIRGSLVKGTVIRV